MGGVRLRPHHLLCIQGFRGQGYSPTFIANLARLKDMLNELPETMIEIADGADDICSFCPHLDRDVCMRPGQRVNELDGRVLERLGIMAGDTGSWADLTTSVRDKIDGDSLKELCHGCSWLDLGFCARGVEQLADRRQD